MFYKWMLMNSSSTTLPVFNSHSPKIATIRTCATSDIVCLPICMCGMMLWCMWTTSPTSELLTCTYS